MHNIGAILARVLGLVDSEEVPREQLRPHGLQYHGNKSVSLLSCVAILSLC